MSGGVGTSGKDPFLIALIILLSMFGPISTDMYLVCINDMRDYFHTTDAMMSMTLYSFMASMAVAIIVMGTLSDKFGRKPVLVVSMIDYIAFSLLCSFAPNVGWMIFFRIMQAIGAGAAVTIAMALIKDRYRGPMMKRVLEIVAIVGVLGPIISPILGAMLSNAFDWKATFWAPAIIAVIALVMLMLHEETLPENERYKGPLSRTFSGMFAILRMRSFMIFAVFTGVVYITFFAYLSVSTYIYKETFGLSSTMDSVMLAVTMALSVMMMEVFVFIQKRTSTVFVTRAFILLAILGTVLLFTVGKNSEYTFLISIIPIVAIVGCTRPIGFNLLLNQFDGDTGAATSLLNFMTFFFGVIGMISASLLGKPYVDAVGWCALVSASVLILCALLLHFSKEKLKGLETM